MRGLIATEIIHRLTRNETSPSDSEVDRALGLLRIITADASAQKQVASVSRHWKDRQLTSYAVLRRFLREVDPGCQRRLATNFLVKHHWEGGSRRSYLRNKGISLPYTICVSPTTHSNIAPGPSDCQYERHHDLMPGDFDRVLREAKKLGIHLVSISGGEPLMYKPLLEIASAHLDITLVLHTNGTLITDALAAEFLQLGNIVPVLGLDGFDEQTDRLRGKGIFGEVMKAMDILRKQRLPFGFCCTVTQENAETVVGDLFNDMLVAKGCLFGLHIPYFPVSDSAIPSLMPTGKQRYLLHTQGAPRIRATKPLFVLDYLSVSKLFGGCRAGGRDIIHVTPHGDVEPGLFWPFATDNIKEKSLRECLKSSYFAEVQEHQDFLWNPLRNCLTVDYPEALRYLCFVYRAAPTQRGAEALIGSLAPTLDAYAEEAGEVLDRVWKKESKPSMIAVPSAQDSRRQMVAV